MRGFKGSGLLNFDHSIWKWKNVLKSNAIKWAQKNVFEKVPLLNVWLMALEKSLRVDLSDRFSVWRTTFVICAMTDKKKRILPPMGNIKYLNCLSIFKVCTRKMLELYRLPNDTLMDDGHWCVDVFYGCHFINHHFRFSRKHQQSSTKNNTLFFLYRRS